MARECPGIRWANSPVKVRLEGSLVDIRGMASTRVVRRWDSVRYEPSIPHIVLEMGSSPKLTFWVKGTQGGEKMTLQFRDSNSLNYMPQSTYNKLPVITTEWQKVVVPLSELKGIDISALDMAGAAFGKDVGNMRGEVVYVDDFMLSNQE